MKFTCSVAALATFVSLVSAQAKPGIISITSPLAGSTITAGQVVHITWINAQVPTISKIVLAQGPNTALQPVQNIDQNVDATKGEYDWHVPATLPAGNDYAIEFGTSPDLAFTGPLTLKAADGSTAPSTNTTTADTTTGGSSIGSTTTTPTTPNTNTGSTSNTNTGAGAPIAPVSGGNSSPSTATSGPHGSGADRIHAAGKVVAALGVVAAVAQLL